MNSFSVTTSRLYTQRLESKRDDDSPVNVAVEMEYLDTKNNPIPNKQKHQEVENFWKHFSQFSLPLQPIKEKLKKRIEEYAECWPTPFCREIHTINIKKNYFNLLDALLKDLALFFGINETNSLDILKELEKKNIIASSTGELLKMAFREIDKICLRLPLGKDDQNDLVFLQPTFSGLVLTQSEIESLEKIYFLVLQPLYHCVEVIIISGKSLEEIFNNIKLTEIAFTRVYKVIRFNDVSYESMKTIRTLVFHVVSAFVEQNVPEKKHFENYNVMSHALDHSSEETDLESLRQAYLEALEKNGASLDLIKQLADIPTKSGLRQSTLREIRHFHKTLISMNFIEKDEEKKEGITKERKDSKETTFKQTSTRNTISKSKSSSTSLRTKEDMKVHETEMVPIKGIQHFNFRKNPNQPLVEYAIYSLTSRIAGKCTPITELIRFEETIDDELGSYPVLASEIISGKTLEQIERTTGLDNLNLGDVQWQQWSWMLLCSILTRPGNGFLSEYILTENNFLYCMDNESSFITLVSEEYFSPKVNFCSAIFCFFSNKALHPDVVEQFCQLDINSIIKGWINDVLRKEKEYLSLLDNEERRLFKTNALFYNGTIGTLEAQFRCLQSYLHKNKAATALDLLSQLIDVNCALGSEFNIGKEISQQYQNALVHPAEKRLQVITSRTKAKFILKEGTYSLSKGQEELFENLYNGINCFREKDGRVVIQVNFQTNIGDTLDIEKQKLILQKIYYWSLHQPASTLTIKHCDALDTKWLVLFLNRGLQNLDLSFCPNLKDNDILLIQQTCPQLRSLHLIGNRGIENVALKRRLRSPVFFEFHQLEVLHLEECSQLTTVKLIAPQLLSVKAISNKFLRTIEFIAPVFPMIEADVPSFTQQIKKSILQNLLDHALVAAKANIPSTSDDFAIISAMSEILELPVFDIIHYKKDQAKKVANRGSIHKNVLIEYFGELFLWKILRGSKELTRVPQISIKKAEEKKEDDALLKGSFPSYNIKSGTTSISSNPFTRPLLALDDKIFFANFHIIELWDPKKKKQLATFEGHRGQINTLLVSNGILITGSDDTTIRLWNIVTGTCICVLKQKKEVKLLTWEKGFEHKILVGVSEGFHKKWLLETGKRLIKERKNYAPYLNLLSNPTIENLQQFIDIARIIESLEQDLSPIPKKEITCNGAILVKSRWIVPLHTKSKVKLYDLKTDKLIFTIIVDQPQETRALPNGLLATRSPDGINIWNPKNGNLIQQIPRDESIFRYESLGILPGGEIISTAPNDTFNPNEQHDYDYDID